MAHAHKYSKTAVRGKLLTRDVNGQWGEAQILNFYDVIKTQATSPRILCILPSDKPNPKPYERLAVNDDCKRVLTTDYKFPMFLFEKTWYEGNGFAGLRQYSKAGSPTITVSWLRVLVKIIKKIDEPPHNDKDYYWHEMTFLIHDSDQGAPTIICCDVDDRDKRFYKNMLEELNVNFRQGLDWKGIHTILFRQIACEVDVSVWACSKAVRELEQKRPDSRKSLKSNVEFQDYHNLLRHALHTSETLQAACSNLKDWLSSYEKITTTQVQNTVQPEDHHYDMINSFQLIQNLLERADSNEARIRNEIGLAFNTVSQQDAKAVRIISVVTLLFFPATFVSTLFSMSFFSFQPGYQDRWGVSSKIWIYFVVTIPLTIVTIILWSQASRILAWFEDLKSPTWVTKKKKDILLFGFKGIWM